MYFQNDYYYVTVFLPNSVSCTQNKETHFEEINWPKYNNIPKVKFTLTECYVLLHHAGHLLGESGNDCLTFS